MKKKALPLLALLASSFATTGVYAKVTYEDALNSQQELIESRRASAARVPTTGVDPREYQESGTTNEWRTIFQEARQAVSKFQPMRQKCMSSAQKGENVSSIIPIL